MEQIGPSTRARPVYPVVPTAALFLLRPIAVINQQPEIPGLVLDILLSEHPLPRGHAPHGHTPVLFWGLSPYRSGAPRHRRSPVRSQACVWASSTLRRPLASSDRKTFPVRRRDMGGGRPVPPPSQPHPRGVILYRYSFRECRSLDRLAHAPPEHGHPCYR